MKIFRIFLYIIFFVFISYCFYFYFSPLGFVKYKHNFEQRYKIGKGFIYKLGPQDRIFSNNKIIANPVYFYLKSFRNFSKAKVKLKYKISEELLSNKDFIDINFGVLRDKNNWRYDLYPFYNNILNDLESFDVQNNGDFIFVQKNNKYPNYIDFLNSNDFDSAYFYNFKVDYNFILNDYVYSEESLELKNIRASYSFFTYIKDHDLNIDFSFSKLDLNKKQNVSIFVYLKDSLIFREELPDDLFVDNNLNYFLNLKDLPEGSYKIELKSDDNLLSKRIKINSSKLVFLNRVYLYNTEKGVDLFANGSDFFIKIINSDCLADFKIDDQMQNINKIYQQFKFNLNKDDLSLSNIKSNSCGALIEGASLFSFSEESFFNPLTKNLSKKDDLNKAEYLLARYKPVKTDADFFVSEFDVDLSSAVKDKKSYNFMISAPFLDSFKNSEYIELYSIEFELTSSSFLDKIKQFINKWIK